MLKVESFGKALSEIVPYLRGEKLIAAVAGQEVERAALSERAPYLEI